ncbi:YceI family protein [Amnibacterium setariae]|uniref:YceI family protein n=1 Tax=Amnibacterium setariae TaxID=2306585 RepID=UPI001F40E829|nr:YceI family protein [Amnibacterium setariae]
MSIRRRTKVLIVVGAVVVVGAVAAATAGPVLYRDLVVGPPDAAPSLQAQEEDAPTPTVSASVDPLAALPSSWRVARGSYAGYRVDERLNGTPVTVTGRNRAVSGTVETSGTRVSAATIVVDLRKVATSEPARDAYFRSTAIDTDRHPTATFTLTGPIAAPAGTRIGAVTEVVARGTLELHGTKREVSAPLQAVVGAESSKIAGSIPIRFSDYGVTAPDLAFVQVEKTGRIEFQVELTPAG